MIKGITELVILLIKALADGKITKEEALEMLTVLVGIIANGKKK